MVPGFPGPMNVAKTLRQLQKFQESMLKLQQELADRTVEGTAGGGAVTVVMDGSLRVRQVRIDPASVDPSDLEMLQDLVAAAVNEALRRARELGEQEMGKLSAELGLPGLPGLPGLK